MHFRTVAHGLLAFVLFLALLKADDETKSPTAEQLKMIQEKSLSLLRDVAPAGASGRKLETMSIDGGVIYWGNLFDPEEVVALVNLAPEKPANDDWLLTNSWGTWPCYLSLCVWEKGHWIFRQYLDNANTLSFHDRKDSPHHFVQASRKTGRYEGDYLSWYYDTATKALVRTWEPFLLLGNYLCTTNGFERRSMDETVWVYSYREGKKGDLLAIYTSDEGTGELRNFSITFRDRHARKLWTYSFHPEEEEEEEPPYLNYTVDAVEGQLNEKVENPDTRVHLSAEIKISGGDEPFDSYCFEQLTKLSYTFVDAGTNGSPTWTDVSPKMPPIKPVKFEITGDPEIVRNLKNP